MKKQILTIILGIFLIGTISALTGGECVNVTFPNVHDVNISFSGNSSDMEGFTWEKNGTLIEYCTALNFAPDNFTVRWYNYETIIIEEKPKHESWSGTPSTPSPIIITTQSLKSGIETGLVGKKELKFTLSSSEQHTLNIANIQEDSVTLRIRSEEQFVTLKEGESEKVVFDNPCKYELLIEVTKILKSSNFVRMKLTEINEEIKGCQKVLESIKDGENDRKEEPRETEEENEGGDKRIFFVIGIILVFFLILYVIDYGVSKLKKKDVEDVEDMENTEFEKL